MHLFRRPSGLFLILVALLTVPFATVAWEEPSPDAEAREAFPSRPMAKLAAPSVVVSQTPSRATRTPVPSPPVRTSVRILTGRLNQ
ncbi:MAG TPA: hypothetical protein VLB76_19325 [Thermoanaerobaculia bacterium]|jgi:uncharacterized membrane protein YidH (DUF202 family)|nr:hypothetical protein [Thermoanaerobaculia bacterium]